MAAETTAANPRRGRDWQRHLGDQAAISPGAFGDNIAVQYTSLADDSAQSKARREASMLASVAEKQLDEGLDHKEALKAATEAVGKCYEMGDKDAMADMLRLVIKAYLLRAGIARNDKASGAKNVVAESLKKAEQIAQGELALFRQAGCVRGQAAMLLSSADILLDKRTGIKSAALALQAASEARTLFQKMGDKKMEAVALLTLVNAYGASGDKQQALEAANSALAILRETGDKPGEAKALHAVARARVVSDSYAAYTDAIQLAKDALALFEELGNKREQANELLAIAAMNLERDCPEQAIPPAKQSIGLFRQIGHDAGAQTAAVSTLVQAYQALDEDAQALSVATEGLAWTQNTGDKRQEIITNDMLAHIHLRNDDVEAAVTQLKEALTIARDLGDKEWEARLLLTMCQAQVRQRELSVALKSIRESVFILKTLSGAERDLAVAHHMRADILCMTQEFEEAVEAAREALDYFAGAEDYNGQGTVMLLIAALSGASNEALDTAVQAQELFKKAGETRLESLALNAIVDIHVSSKDWEKAAEIAALRRTLLQEAGYRKEEAKTLHTTAAVYLASGDATNALKVAREGMRMARAEGDKFTEVHMSIQAVHASLVLIADAADPDSKAIRNMLEEATKMAKDAVALAKKVAHGRLNGPALFWQGQVLNISLSPDAVAAASGALSSFQREGDRLGEAHATFLLAQCNLSSNRPKAEELLQSALTIFVEVGDANGQALVQTMMMQSRPMEMGSFMPMMPMANQGGAGASMGPGEQIKKGPDPLVVKNKIRQLVGEALDADEISLDTPLMDSGLDSLASVSFRNDVSKEFSTTLPASLIFDYPTISSLTSYMIELLEDQ